MDVIKQGSIVKPGTIGYQAIPGLVVQLKKLQRRHSIEEIAEAVSRRTGISMNHIRTKTRLRSIVECRQMIFYIGPMVVRPGYSTIEMGKFWQLGHATVIHGRRNIRNLLRTDKEIMNKIADIIADLKLDS